METRYTIEEVCQTNKIVGVKLPMFKKVQWAIYGRYGLNLVKPILMTTTYEIEADDGTIKKENFKWNESYFQVIPEGTFTQNIIRHDLSQYKNGIPINCIVSVDISKAHITDEIKNKPTSELLRDLDLSRLGYLKIQTIIEIKAELLLRPDKKNKPNKHRGNKKIIKRNFKSTK